MDRERTQAWLDDRSSRGSSFYMAEGDEMCFVVRSALLSVWGGLNRRVGVRITRPIGEDRFNATRTEVDRGH
jgi:hypothetical protein